MRAPLRVSAVLNYLGGGRLLSGVALGGEARVLSGVALHASKRQSRPSLDLPYLCKDHIYPKTLSPFANPSTHPPIPQLTLYVYQVCTYTCMYLSMYICTYVCMHVCMYVCLYIIYTGCQAEATTPTHTHTHPPTHTHTYMHIYMCIKNI